MGLVLDEVGRSICHLPVDNPNFLHQIPGEKAIYQKFGLFAALPIVV